LTYKEEESYKTDIHTIDNIMSIQIGKIRQNRETNSSSVKEQKRIIQDEIQELRTNCGIQCILYKDFPHILDTKLPMA
jgi:hypothetical protein